MDKEERYVFVYNSYDVDEFVYDKKDRLRIDNLNKCCNVLNWKEDKIADLEAQLAESEKELEIVCVDGKDKIRELCEETCRQQEEIFKLKHQLAEERKRVVQEIKKLVIESTCYDTEEEVRNHLYDMSAGEVLEILDQIDQQNQRTQRRKI